MRDMLLNLSQLLLAQLHPEGCNVLLQVLDALCAWDRENILTLVVHPGERQLAQRATLLVCKLPHLLRQLLVLQLHILDPVNDNDFESRFIRATPLEVLRPVACHAIWHTVLPCLIATCYLIFISLSCSMVPAMMQD